VKFQGQKYLIEWVAGKKYLRDTATGKPVSEVLRVELPPNCSNKLRKLRPYIQLLQAKRRLAE